MIQYSSLALLPLTVYGTPSGNYDGSSTSFIGNAIPAANYYAGQGIIQTLTYTGNAFVGVITVQATLNENTPQSAWFDIDTYGNANVATTDTESNSIMGNFSYLRAKVDNFTAGNITSVTAAY
jgi:hypothetical protein